MSLDRLFCVFGMHKREGGMVYAVPNFKRNESIVHSAYDCGRCGSLYGDRTVEHRPFTKETREDYEDLRDKLPYLASRWR